MILPLIPESEMQSLLVIQILFAHGPTCYSLWVTPPTHTQWHYCHVHSQSRAAGENLVTRWARSQLRMNEPLPCLPASVLELSLRVIFAGSLARVLHVLSPSLLPEMAASAQCRRAAGAQGGGDVCQRPSARWDSARAVSSMSASPQDPPGGVSKQKNT